MVNTEGNETLLAHKFYQAVFLSSPDASAIIDSQARYVEQNDAHRFLLGYSDAELLGQTPQLHTEDAVCERVLSALLKTGRFEGEIVSRRKDGTYVDIELKVSSFRAENGELYYVGIKRDITVEKRAEQALRVRDEQFRALVNQATVGVAQVDLEGRFTLVNRRYCEILGYTEKELLDGMRMQDVTHSEDLSKNVILFNRLAEGGPDFVIEKRYIRKDGMTVWVSNSVGAIRDAETRVRSIAAVVVDITARKRAEEQERASEERFRTLADNMSQFAWMADATGSTFWFNRRWFDYTGTTLEQMTGEGWKNVVHAAHLNRVLIGTRRAWATGEPWEDTFPIRGSGGQYRWFLSRAVPIRDQRGDIVRWLGTNTDVTEVRVAKEALQRRETQLRVITDGVPALISYLDREEHYRFVNAGYEATFGLPREKILGRTAKELLGPAYGDVAPYIEQVLAGESVWFETDLVYAGVPHIVQVSYKPDIGPDGTIAGFYVLVTDISERKRQENELRQWKDRLEVRVAERTQELLASKERLRALASQLSLTEQRERRKLASDLHDYLAQLLVVADMKLQTCMSSLSTAVAEPTLPLLHDLHEILQESLTYARTTIAELSPPALHQADLPAALTWLTNQMERHGLWVTVETHSDELTLPEDHAVLLFQSVRELLFNVLKHAGVNHATVSLHVTDEATVVLTVADAGEGLDADALRRSTEPGHFGLLAVRERMEAMGGWLKLDSEPGAGTRAELGLPLSRPASKE